MGLREAKKQKIRREIIENAIALFREAGYEATRVKAIAARAEVSEATFFNYFPTKDAVLCAWAHAAVDRAFESASGLADRGVRPQVRSLCNELASQVEADRDFAAQAWLRARLAVPTPSSATHLFELAQQQGRLRRDVSARQLGEILYGSICGTIGSWLGRAGPQGSLGAELRRAADLVLDGARSRNERVRAGAGVGGGIAAGQSLSTR